MLALWPGWALWLANASRKWSSGPIRKCTRFEFVALFGTALSAFPVMFLARYMTASSLAAYILTFVIMLVVNWYAQRKVANNWSAMRLAEDSKS